MLMSRFEQIVFKLNTPIPPVVFLARQTQDQGHQDHQALERNKKASAKELRQSICTPDRYFHSAKRQTSGNNWMLETLYSTIRPDSRSRMVLFAAMLD